MGEGNTHTHPDRVRAQTNRPRLECEQRLTFICQAGQHVLEYEKGSSLPSLEEIRQTDV